MRCLACRHLLLCGRACPIRFDKGTGSPGALAANDMMHDDE